MKTWKFARYFILLGLMAGLGWTLLYRGPARFAVVSPATLETPYKTEQQWATGETAADLEEMAAFAAKRAPSSAIPRADPSLVPWDPDAFALIARQALGNAESSSGAPSSPDVYPELANLTTQVLTAASATVSADLARDMRSARSHEAAALVLGAFALREAAERYSDVRWAMNRMAAHLAFATALRNGSAPSVDGSLARVVLMALADRHEHALAALAQLGQGSPPSELSSWVRALRIRVTKDWRLLPNPVMATRLEKLEYFRARRATVGRNRAADDLQTIAVEIAPDFTHIVESHNWGVSDGMEYVSPALEAEIVELTETHRAVAKAPMPAKLHDALNQRAPRLITSTGPEVLPWGAWAEYYQRHIAMHIAKIDHNYRYMQGSYEHAEELKTQIDHDYGELTWFPMGAGLRNKGKTSSEADFTYIAGIVDVAARAPELITFDNWWFWEWGSKSESVAALMPPYTAWFPPRPSLAAPYQAGLRLSTNGGGMTAPMLDELMGEASSDLKLLSFAYERLPPADPVSRRVKALLLARADYDGYAIDTLLKKVADDTERAELERLACKLASRSCMDLALTLSRLGDEAGAVREFERAFSDPMMDGVALSASAGWLVNYYYRHNRTEDALKLATRAASSGSADGAFIEGRLFERLGRLDEAEDRFLGIETHYDNAIPAIGFYHRQFVVAKNEKYSEKWRRHLEMFFPQGLQAVPATMPVAPKSGVFVEKDSDRSRKAGMQAGDIIVGLEGWRVDNRNQYHAINAFSDNERMKLTIWRGALIPIEADVPGRLFGTTLQTHPMKGWIE